MKKIVILLLIALFPTMVFAKEYVSDVINTKIDINDNYIVLTRDNINDESILAKLNISKEYIEDVMTNSDIYFVITKSDISYEIILAVPDNTIPFSNLNDVDNVMLNTIKDDFVEKTGSEVLNYYKNDYRFLIVDYYDKDTDYYVLNYYTVVNARGYNFQLQKKTAITEEERQEFKDIIDNVTITEIKEEKNEEPAITNNFNYNNIIYAIIIGSLAGIITYYVDVLRRKKKSSK